MVNILSIDWDYFIRSTMSQRAHFFPDGVTDNMGLDAQSFLWNRSYAHSVAAKEFCDGEKSLMEITVLDDEIVSLYELVEKYKKSDTRMSVHESHAEIVSIIRQNFANADEINVFNIDSNHDCDNISLSEISYGNWGLFLLNRKEIQHILWVRRDDGNNENSGHVSHEYSSVRELHNSSDALMEGIDYIFICRSGARTPPHLDNSFQRMVLHLVELIGLVMPYTPDGIAMRWTKKNQDEINDLIKNKRFANDYFITCKNND